MKLLTWLRWRYWRWRATREINSIYGSQTDWVKARAMARNEWMSDKARKYWRELQQ